MKRQRKSTLLGSAARLHFGRRLRRLRRDRDLSQEALGALADLDQNYIGGIERGHRNPSRVNICRLAGALGVEPSVLMEGVPAVKDSE